VSDMINLFNSIGTILRFFNYNPYVGVATGALYSVYSLPHSAVINCLQISLP
jgi:hypothetical protein